MNNGQVMNEEQFEKKLKIFKIKGEKYKVIKEFKDSFLTISEFGFNLKRIPKLKRIK